MIAKKKIATDRSLTFGIQEYNFFSYYALQAESLTRPNSLQSPLYPSLLLSPSLIHPSPSRSHFHPTFLLVPPPSHFSLIQAKFFQNLFNFGHLSFFFEKILKVKCGFLRVIFYNKSFPDVFKLISRTFFPDILNLQ